MMIFLCDAPQLSAERRAEKRIIQSNTPLRSRGALDNITEKIHITNKE